MPSAIPIQPENTGRLLTDIKDAIQKSMEVANTGKLQTGGPGISTNQTPQGTTYTLDQQIGPQEHWWGEIVCVGICDGESTSEREAPGGNCASKNNDTGPVTEGGCQYGEFTDNRYYVVKCRNTNDSTDSPCAAVIYEKLSPLDGNYEKIIATNLSEENCRTHLLSPGSKVHVWVEWDGGEKPQKRYCFSSNETCGSRTCEQSSSSGSSGSSSQSSSGSSGSSSQSSSGSSGSSSQSSSGSSGSSSQSSAGSTSQSSAGSTGSSGSEKSIAIVPASWSPTKYTALFIAECPEVRFDDVITIPLLQMDRILPIDPKYIEVCEPDTIRICGCVPSEPILVGAKIEKNTIKLKFAEQDIYKLLEITIRLTAIRKGFNKVRFPDRTEEQFISNEAFINSAYKGA